MKKILEVLEYGKLEVRFNTDIDDAYAMKDPDYMPHIIFNSAYCMTTKLWGGNELSVLAMIRLLAITSLAVCDNREEVLEHLAHDSKELARVMKEGKEKAREEGIEIIEYPPYMMPPAGKN